MGFLNSFVDWTIAFFTGFFGNVVAHDFCEMAPMLSRKIVEAAAAQLPPTIKDRYLEEWFADLRDRPGTLSKIKWALGCLMCAHRLRREASADQRRSRSIEFGLENGEVLVIDGPSFAVFYSMLRVQFHLSKWLPGRVRYAVMVAAVKTSELRWRRCGQPDYRCVVRLLDYVAKNSKFPAKVTGLEDGKVVHTFH